MESLSKLSDLLQTPDSPETSGERQPEARLADIGCPIVRLSYQLNANPGFPLRSGERAEYLAC